MICRTPSYLTEEKLKVGYVGRYRKEIRNHYNFSWIIQMPEPGFHWKDQGQSRLPTQPTPERSITSVPLFIPPSVSGDRDNPVALGVPGYIVQSWVDSLDAWDITVVAVNEDAEGVILDEYPTHKSAGVGKHFYMVTLEAKNVGTDRAFFPESSLRARGNHTQIDYTTLGGFLWPCTGVVTVRAGPAQLGDHREYLLGSGFPRCYFISHELDGIY